jgi:hypothetical protein
MYAVSKKQLLGVKPGRIFYSSVSCLLLQFTLILKQINGTEVAHMQNYYYKTTGVYYFPGMWTAILPMIPGIYAIYRLTKEYRLQNKQH